MSLIMNEITFKTRSAGIVDDYTVEDQRDLERLDRYLALIENNRKSCRFVPDDALMALDMAGFVRGKLRDARPGPNVSAARLAMALVQSADNVKPQ